MTGMSKTNGAGVAANHARKRRLWLLVGGFAAVGVAADAVMIPMVRHAPAGGPYLTAPIALAAAAILVLMTTAGVALYLRWVDELEYQHNLAAFSVGFLFNVAAFIAWYVLSLAQLAGPPRADTLFFSSAAVAAVAYCWMKVKAHLG